MRNNRTRAISKELSRNDTGETGGHQAGILVPKDSSILRFFPSLDSTQYNPRHEIAFHDTSANKWVFAFIYYNNRAFGGTRNEYRLTRMTSYMRSNNLLAGDVLILSRDEDSRYNIDYRRRSDDVKNEDRLVLGSGWKVIRV